MGLDFLSVRFYAGAWIFVISFIVVALDGSRLLKYVTRFTEEIFAVLISAIFLAESIKFMKNSLVISVSRTLHCSHSWYFFQHFQSLASSKPSDKATGLADIKLFLFQIYFRLVIRLRIFLYKYYFRLLLSRKERKLIKGTGMNWDLLLMGKL
uniref:HCO3_cotransp domain-containing protein n=1 Tax=Heterorhabditis bacteriophora TaxID=37862 RepID=A0A1I7X8Y3_HETBA